MDEMRFTSNGDTQPQRRRARHELISRMRGEEKTQGLFARTHRSFMRNMFFDLCFMHSPFPEILLLSS